MEKLLLIILGSVTLTAALSFIFGIFYMKRRYKVTPISYRDFLINHLVDLATEFRAIGIITTFKKSNTNDIIITIESGDHNVKTLFGIKENESPTATIALIQKKITRIVKEKG